MKKTLLWVGDAGVPSGFALATHKTLDVLRETFNVVVLGINYRGDPHDYPYPIYACAPGGDAMGYGRIVWMCDKYKPDVIVLQNDPWNIPFYVRQLRLFKEHNHVKIVGAIAVDALNCKGAGLNLLDFAIFWTDFGLNEAREGGFTKNAAVVPLGVDTTTFYPDDLIEARRRGGLSKQFDDAYIVGNVNRNQPRKRLDLTIRYFCKWIDQHSVDNAYLLLHVAPTGDMGYDCRQLMNYYGHLDRLLTITPPAFYGVSEAELRDTYNCFNVQLTTTQGEGFGLTTFEGMACGVLQIVPRWSALEELVGDVTYGIECTSTAAMPPPEINTIGGVMDEDLAVQALADIYQYPSDFAAMRASALARVNEPRFNWRNVGEAFRDALKEVL